LKDLNLGAFTKSDKEDWLKLAEKQLKGGNPNTILEWTNQANHQLHGYYDASDLKDLEYLEDFFTHLPNHRWKLYEEVQVEEPKSSNKKIIDALMGGCDGIILQLSNQSILDASLVDVNREICDISIRFENSIEFNLNSGFMLTPNGNATQLLEHSNPETQILEALKTEKKATIYRLAFPDFFLEIATIRALRFLLHEQEDNDTLIHTHVPLHESSEHQWFLNTTVGLASILGGTNSVDFSTAQGDSRISRNIGNLIREESGINEYTDQCGGSYYVEILTHHLIQGVKKNR